MPSFIFIIFLIINVLETIFSCGGFVVGIDLMSVIVRLSLYSIWVYVCNYSLSLTVSVPKQLFDETTYEFSSKFSLTIMRCHRIWWFWRYFYQCVLELKSHSEALKSAVFSNTNPWEVCRENRRNSSMEYSTFIQKWCYFVRFWDTWLISLKHK